MVLLGDVNTDCLCSEKSKHAFIDTLNTTDLTQLMNMVTRTESRACLDHIWCTHPERMINTRIVNNGMSDHVPVLSTRIYKRAILPRESHTRISSRDFKNLE